MTPPRNLAAVLIIGGAVLAVAGILLRVVIGAAADPQLAAFMADGFLLGFLLLASGVALLGRPR